MAHPRQKLIRYILLLKLFDLLGRLLENNIISQFFHEHPADQSHSGPLISGVSLIPDCALESLYILIAHLYECNFPENFFDPVCELGHAHDRAIAFVVITEMA